MKFTYKDIHKCILHLKNKMLERRKVGTADSQTATSYYNALAEIDSYFLVIENKKLIKENIKLKRLEKI